MNQQNPQLGPDPKELLLDKVMSRVAHWARIQSLQSALKSVGNTEHSRGAKYCAGELLKLIHSETWTVDTIEGLVSLAQMLRDEKVERESRKAGRTAQRSAQTITSPALADIAHSIIEYCEHNAIALPSGSAELVFGQNFPSASKNGVKRLKAALITAIQPTKSAAERARLADLDRGALGGWEKEQSFVDLVQLIANDSWLANQALLLYD